MKKLISYLTIFIGVLIFSSNLFSQSFDQLTLIAHYPLKSTANDTTGRYEPIELVNTPYQDGGIYCNGIYLDGISSNACDARTPNLDELAFRSLAISAQFKINDYPAERMPVIVCDPIGWRWLYVFIDPDSTIGFGSGDEFADPSSTGITCKLQQWHTVTVIWDSLSSQMTFYFNSIAVDSIMSLTLEHGDSRHAGITHGGVGRTFKGWLRHFKIYSYTTVTDVAVTESTRPGEYSLSQNYPNPFNPETSIQYQMTKSTSVKLIIFNLKGQQVTTLVDDVQAAGSYKRQWNGKDYSGNDVASGTYLYRLETPDVVKKRKLILIR